MTFGKLLIIPLNLYKSHTEELVSKFTHMKMSLLVASQQSHSDYCVRKW